MSKRQLRIDLAKVARSWVAADMRIIRYDEAGAFEAELA
jgi:hypothetical protein